MQTRIHPKISVVLLDDHPLIRLSFKVAAQQENDIELLESFGRSRELLNWLKTASAGVLVLDYFLDNDEIDGLSLIKRILAHYPYQRILISSSMESLAVIHAALLAGVKGYINKRESPKSYFEAIRTLAAGRRYIPAEVELGLAQMHGRASASLYSRQLLAVSHSSPVNLNLLLTPRESEVLRYYMEGLTVSDIGIKLKRSRKTISSHKQTGMKKLGVSSDMELLKYRDDLFK